MTESEKQILADRETITKIEDAEYLLNNAITLFFDDGDLFTADTLTARAYDVLNSLLSRPDTAKHSVRSYDLIRPEHLKEYTDHINRMQGFLKYAEQNPDQGIEFHNEATAIWIFDALLMYIRLTGTQKFRAFAIFLAWFTLNYSHWLKAGGFPSYVYRVYKSGPLKKEHFSKLIKNPDLLPMPDLL
jgi:hypothetical protein